MSPLSIFSFDYEELSHAMHTLFTQEMLKRGFLASKAFYATYSHYDSHIKVYHAAVKEVFALISSAVENDNIMHLLNGLVAHAGFKR